MLLMVGIVVVVMVVGLWWFFFFFPVGVVMVGVVTDVVVLVGD